MTLIQNNGVIRPPSRQDQITQPVDINTLIVKYNEFIEEFQTLNRGFEENKIDHTNRLINIENSIKDLRELLNKNIENSSNNNTNSLQRKGRISVAFPLTYDSLIRCEGIHSHLIEGCAIVNRNQLLFEFDTNFPKNFSIHVCGYFNVRGHLTEALKCKIYVGSLGQEKKYSGEIELSTSRLGSSYAEFEINADEYNNIITIAMPEVKGEYGRPVIWNGGHDILLLKSLKIISRKEERNLKTIN